MRKNFFADIFVDPKNTIIRKKFTVPNTQLITPKNEGMQHRIYAFIILIINRI